MLIVTRIYYLTLHLDTFPGPIGGPVPYVTRVRDFTLLVSLQVHCYLVS